MADVENILKRIYEHPGVLGVIVVNEDGIPIRTTMDTSTTQLYTGNYCKLAALARSSIRDLDPLNDLKFLRVRSKKTEIMIAPENDYILIVIQNPDKKEV